jgi:hypothetical protein
VTSTAADALRAFPPVVYAPTLDLPEQGQVALELIETNDGRTALFVYSALDRFVEYYSPSSPWVLLSVEDLQRAYEARPYDLLFLDRRPRPARASGEDAPA